MLELFIAFPCAVVGYVYAAVLLEKGNLLDFLGEAISSKHADAVNEDKKIQAKFWLMLMCHLCVSGQLALWTYLTINFWTFNIYSVPSLVFTISLSILLAKIFQKWS